MGRFGITLADAAPISVSISGVLVPWRDDSETDKDLEYSDDDESDEAESDEDEDEEEPPHPLGFPSSSARTTGGKCRYSVHSSPVESLEAYKRRMGCQYPYEVQELISSKTTLFTPPRQLYPPLSSYIDPHTASTPTLLRCAQSLMAVAGPSSLDADYDDNESGSMEEGEAGLRSEDIREIVELFDDTHLDTTTSVVSTNDPFRELSIQSLVEPYHAMQRDQRKVQAEMNYVREPWLKEHQDRKKALKRLIQKHVEAADAVRKEQAIRDAEHERETEAQERLAEDRRQAEAEQQKQDRQKLLQERAEEQAKQQQVAKVERQAKETAAKELEHVAKAHKLVAQLVQLRASVEPFETSSAASVKKRRLQMKKLVGGKVNTLTENSEKIKSVAAEVSQAIAAAREDDEQMKQQLNAGAPGVSPEMARGKRYLVDLLSSKVMVRVQAEGFNGYVFFLCLEH